MESQTDGRRAGGSDMRFLRGRIEERPDDPSGEVVIGVGEVVADEVRPAEIARPADFVSRFPQGFCNSRHIQIATAIAVKCNSVGVAKSPSPNFCASL